MNQEDDYSNVQQDPNLGGGQMPPQDYNWQPSNQPYDPNQGNFQNFNEPIGQYQYEQNQPSYENQPEKKSAWKIILIMVLVIVLLVAVIALVGKYYFKNTTAGNTPNNVNLNNLNLGTNTTTSPVMTPERVAAEKKDRPYLGNPKASLVIVEFGDFQCSKCQEEYTQIRQAVLKYKNDVLFIFRNFPIIDDNSSVLAKAGLCANEQGRFWQFHDKLYINQGSIDSVDTVNALATQSGIDLNAFSSCLSSGKYNNMLSEDTNDAQALGVIGTPTFFVNGNKLEGTISASDWESVIQKFEELKNK